MSLSMHPCSRCLCLRLLRSVRCGSRHGGYRSSGSCARSGRQFVWGWRGSCLKHGCRAVRLRLRAGHRIASASASTLAASACASCASTLTAASVAPSGGGQSGLAGHGRPGTAPGGCFDISSGNVSQNLSKGRSTQLVSGSAHENVRVDAWRVGVWHWRVLERVWEGCAGRMGCTES